MSTDPQPSDVLRSRLIFAGASGILERIDDGFVLRMPEQPTFWWGNALALAHPPREHDYPRWMALFQRHIGDVQPESVHRTFSWDGRDAGVDGAFVNAGFEAIASVVLTRSRDDVALPSSPADDATIPIDGAVAWLEVQDLLIQTRLVQQSFEAYRRFIERRIAGWRALIDAGHGAWFGIRHDHRLVSTLGVFVEGRAGHDGCRVGRFQHIATHRAARHAGLAGTIIAHATRHAFERLGADRLLIVADADASQQAMYEAAGFRVTGHQRGLERVQGT